MYDTFSSENVILGNQIPNIQNSEISEQSSEASTQSVIADTQEPIQKDYTIPFAFIAVLGIIFGLMVFSLLSKRWHT